MAAIVLTIAARPRLTLTEVAQIVRLPSSTTHRLLSALVTGRLVERNADGRYELRLEGARRRYDSSVLREFITGSVTDLVEVIGSSVRFGVWHEHGVSAFDQPGGCRYGADASGYEILPIHATALGKALLAFAPNQEIRRVLARPLPRYTSRTITTPDALAKALSRTRSQGMAVAMREFSVHECALAVPVFGPNGVIASLEVLGSESVSDITSLAPAVRLAARALGRRLAEHRAWLPTGAGRNPLQWLIDPALLAAADDAAQEVLAAPSSRWRQPVRPRLGLLAAAEHIIDPEPTTTSRSGKRANC